MKISIDLIRDSFNSYTKGSIEFEVKDEAVVIMIEDYDGKDRELVVDRDELSKLISYI